MEKMNRKAIKDEKEKLKKFLSKVSLNDGINQEMKDGLRYISGEMKSPNVEVGELNLVRNDIMKWQKWKCAQITQNPYNMSIEAKEDTPEWRAIAETIQEDIDNAINSPRGREATESMFFTQVGVGTGRISFELDYINKRTIEQTVVANVINCPYHVYTNIEDSVDGSGITEALTYRRMDRDYAENLVGKSKLDLSSHDDWNYSMFSHWDYDSNSVPDVTFQYITETRRTQYYDTDGKPSDEKVNGGHSRPMNDKTLNIVRYIGNCRYEASSIDMDYTLIATSRGDRDYRSDLDNEEFTYSGLYQLLKDLQESLIYLYNEAIAIASRTSKAPWIVAEGTVENREEWEDFATNGASILFYKMKLEGGQLAPPPQRANNDAQVEWILSFARSIYADMQSIVGIPPEAMGYGAQGQETVKAVELRNTSSNMAVSSSLDNFEKSLQHCCSIVTDLGIHARPKRLIKYTPEGSEEEIEQPIDLSELRVSSDDFIYVPTQGPANESQRQSELNMLREMGQVAPMQFAKMLDLYVKKFNQSSNKEITERLEAITDIENPNLRVTDDNKEDPQVVAMMEQFTQQMAEQQQMMDQVIQDADQKQQVMAYTIQSLENKLIAQENKNNVDLIKTVLTQQAETERNTQDNAVKLAEAQIEEGKEINLAIIEGESANQQQELEMVKSAIETLPLQEGVSTPQPEEIGEQPKTGQNLDLEIEIENEEGNLEATQ